MKKEKSTSSLSYSEKKILRNRILNSAREIRKRRRRSKKRVAFAAAACFIILLGLIFSKKESDYTRSDNFQIANIVNPQSIEDVTLLVGKQKITIKDTETPIIYTSSGREIKYGKNKMVRTNFLGNESNHFNSIIVPYGKRASLILSDGTRVWVNSGTKLVFPPFFDKTGREVFLEGEAIFDVVHNVKKPFQVISENQSIKVLGTLFDVRVYPKKFIYKTALKRGSVQILYKKNPDKCIELKPGELSSFDIRTNTMKSEKVNSDEYFSWREGFLSIEQRPLKDILMQLSLYYNVDFQLDDEIIGKHIFSGKLELQSDIKKVLDIFQKTSNLNFHRKGGTIYIYSMNDKS